MLEAQDELHVILFKANQRALNTGSTYIDTDHISAAILSNKDSQLAQHLGNILYLPELSWQNPSSGTLPLSTRAKSAISNAVEKCYLGWRHHKLEDAHLLAALIENPDPTDPCIKLLNFWNIDLEDLQLRIEIRLKLLSVSVTRALPSAPLVSQTKDIKLTSKFLSKSPHSIPQQANKQDDSADEKSTETKPSFSDWFDSDALRLIHFAQTSAPPSSAIMVEDLIWSMSFHPDSIAGKTLHTLGAVTMPNTAQYFRTHTSQQRHEVFSDDVLKILSYAFEEARSMGVKKLDSGHLLVAIARAITNKEIRTSFDEQTSLQDISTFREQVTAIRKAFDSGVAEDSKETPVRTTPFRVIDPEAVLKIDGSASSIPCGIVVKTILNLTLAEKRRLRHSLTSYAHIALGLVKESRTTHLQIFNDRRNELEKFGTLLEDIATRINDRLRADQSSTVLQIAWNIAQEFHSNKVEFNHLALAVILYGGRDFAAAWNAASSTNLTVVQRQLESCSVRLAAQNSSLVPDFFLDEKYLQDLAEENQSIPHQQQLKTEEDFEYFLTSSTKNILALASTYASDYNHRDIGVETLIQDRTIA